MGRTNFTDQQKAEVFVLDRATCAYSGRNLWLIDHGIDGRYITDWTDHILPASRSGKSVVENGLCATWLYNAYKKDVVNCTPILFYRGHPTSEFFYIYNEIPRELATNLKRFEKLHYSDWYFNRAMWRMCLGVCWLDDCRQKVIRSRDDIYYARASFRFIQRWRLLVEKDRISSLEDRGLINRRLTEDQQLLLMIRSVASEQDVLRLMKRVLPLHTATRKAVSLLDWMASSKVTASQMKGKLGRVIDDKRVSARVRDMLLSNAKEIYGLRI